MLTFSSKDRARRRKDSDRQQLFIRMSSDRIPPYRLPDDLANRLDWDVSFHRRWTELAGKRIQAAIASTYPSVQLYPGPSPALFTAANKPSCLSDYSHRYQQPLLYYHQWLSTLKLRQSRRYRLSKINTGPKSAGIAGWPWRYVEYPTLFEVAPDADDPGPSVFASPSVKQLIDLLEPGCGKSHLDTDRIRCLFAAVHRAWGMEKIPAYANRDLILGAELLSFERAFRPSSLLVPLVFELEALATYHVLLSKMKPLASGRFGECWLDIGTLPLVEIRGTERCLSNRLFAEVLSMMSGQCAPILVNELACVSDGNHRLTAAWILNILGAARHRSWSLDDDDFQHSIAQYLKGLSVNSPPVSLHEALHHLGKFLVNREKRERLLRTFHRLPLNWTPISSLPVVPLMEYSAVALIGADFDRRQMPVRFHPSHYELLSQHSNLVLPPRACYHFADRIPLPWISFVDAVSPCGSTLVSCIS